MRTLTIFFLIFSISLVLSGCNNVTEEGSTKQKASLIKDHEFGLDSLGEFYRHNKVEDLGTFETGPLSITVEVVETVNGSITTDLRYDDKDEKKNYKSMELISFQLLIELNEGIEDGVTFNEEFIHLLTDSGEMIEQPYESMTSFVTMSLLKYSQKHNVESRTRQFPFLLKESTAEEIEEATLIIDPPVDRNGETLGQEIEIEVDFSKSKD
ncbi:hypothetical protein OBCHQ24_02965 [Oceanobacillus iheyensis]|nr:hypothetical protein OBCHQ24_02965 [Oceanobacillus iheyensis]